MNDEYVFKRFKFGAYRGVYLGAGYISDENELSVHISFLFWFVQVAFKKDL